MNLSIIIPSFNTKALLLRCLKSIDASLSGSSLSSEIIVVDNGSTDGSRELVESGKWKVESEAKSILIENKKNVGYGKANNQGINAAKGEIILLLNSDIKVINNAIEQMYQFVKEHPKSFAGGKLLNEDGSPQASCGPFYTLPVVFFMLFAKGDALGLTRYSPDRDFWTMGFLMSKYSCIWRRLSSCTGPGKRAILHFSLPGRRLSIPGLQAAAARRSRSLISTEDLFTFIRAIGL